MKKEFEIYNNAKNEGMNYSLEFIKKNGIEAFEEELKFRQNTKVPLRITKQAYDEAITKEVERIKMRTFDTIMILAVTTLRDEFDFGKKRVGRFIERFNLKTACLMDPEISGLTWKDLQEYLKEELDLDMKITGEI